MTPSATTAGSGFPTNQSQLVASDELLNRLRRLIAARAAGSGFLTNPSQLVVYGEKRMFMVNYDTVRDNSRFRIPYKPIPVGGFW